ncbi:hypothetical protein ACFLS0_02380 [Candidatus Bipolaricaulota bacterium]
MNSPGERTINCHARTGRHGAKLHEQRQMMFKRLFATTAVEP